MTDPNNAQPPRHGVITRTIGGSLARSWPPPLPRLRRCCVLLLVLLGLSTAAAANKSLSCCCFCCAQCVGHFRLLSVCTQHASCARVRQRAATKARSHQADDRRLARSQLAAPAVPRRRRCCVLLPLLLGLSAAAANNRCAVVASSAVCTVLETFVFFACAHSTPRALAYVSAQPPRHGHKTDGRRLARS